MTATEQEFDRLAALVDLDPPEGEHEVVLAVTNLSDPSGGWCSMPSASR